MQPFGMAVRHLCGGIFLASTHSVRSKKGVNPLLPAPLSSEEAG